ncbi:MAG: DUF1549 domain-containing protein [Pirellula sp.]|jgi:hypothetical protein|nr:DUF1549 domain-containing protein [Pirellula sp.]
MNNRVKKIDNPEEFLFNSVLRDYLRKNNPPALGSKILAELAARAELADESRVENESFGNLKISHIELDEALGAAQADLDYAVMSPPVQANRGESVRTRSYRLEPYFWEYRAFKQLVGLSALAASVVLSVTGYRAWNQGKTENAIARVQSDLPTIPTSPPEPQTEQPDDKTLAQSDTKIDSPQSESSIPAVAPPPPKVVHVAKPTRKVLLQPEPLEVGRLTDVVNSQLHQMWKKHGVEPKLIQGDDENWLARATEGILGRAPTFTESEMFRQQKGSERYAKTVQGLLDSEEFNLHWSQMIAEYLLSQSIGSVPRREISDLVTWVKSELDKGSSVGQIERLLLEVGFEENDPDRNAKLSLFNDTKRKLAYIEEEMRGVDKFLLLRSNDRDTSYVHLANQVLHATGNGTASCVQCHSSDSPVMRVIAPPDRNIADQFWNFAASVKVVAKSRERPTVELGREDQELFYDLVDGNRKIATPGLTVSRLGTASELSVNDQVTLQEWIEQSPDARKGLVETVWQKMLQQPLVPPYRLTEDEADAERRDLKDLLAKQLQATGSIKTIVQSIVLSDVFFVPEAKLTKSWYLASTDAKMSEYHKGARLFSYVPIKMARIAVHRPNSTNTIAKWMEIEKRRGVNLNALAQPNSRNLTKNAAAADKPELEDIDQVRFLLSSTRPYYGIERLANQLSESQMEWDDKLNHLFLLLKGRYPMQTERFDAKYTLELVQQNQLKALIYICTSQLGSF